ncbi:MAG: tRNA (adenosine(37)-N6)-threonylcarbamoyltransferase complex ATPase subunit type 1 TsaE [Phycisphaeraceae bacterium]|nr:tRNA (adenosine(37)-N6)-threonylcarbamoyltransferase complex ATPase subunit type 1 TsaE [Phycisphaeraceae bacterium]
MRHAGASRWPANVGCGIGLGASGIVTTCESPCWQGVTHDADDTARLGHALAQLMLPGDLILLIGELGAGKTQFVRGLARGLGVDTRMVSSPTFVLLHEYPVTSGNPVSFLRHVDAYRLHDLDDLGTMGWDVSTGGGELREQAVLVLEWADRVADAWGDHWLMLRINHLPDDKRRISLNLAGAWRDRQPDVERILQPWTT